MTSTPPSLSRLQHRRKAGLWLAMLPLAAVLFSVAPLWRENSLGEESIEWAGFAFIALAILGRTWCTLYIGGRKKREIVDTGPYSLSRNPLYVFSVAGALGMGMTSGSATLGVIFAAFTFAVFDLVVRREEIYLAERHGALYARYRQTTPRWLSLHAAWRDDDRLEVRPHLVLTTFRDACVMLIAVPVFEAIGSLHAGGHLPVFLHLP